jgi:hypothetical protein
MWNLWRWRSSPTICKDGLPRPQNINSTFMKDINDQELLWSVYINVYVSCLCKTKALLCIPYNLATVHYNFYKLEYTFNTCANIISNIWFITVCRHNKNRKKNRKKIFHFFEFVDGNNIRNFILTFIRFIWLVSKKHV